MTGRNITRTAGVAVLALALLAGAVQVQAAREHAYPKPEILGDSVYITSGSAVRRLTGPFNALAADVYWIRTIQYYGGTRRRLVRRPIGLEPPMPAAVESKEFDQL